MQISADSAGPWHILGAGAIGGLFARRFSQLGHRVTLLSRAQCAPVRSLRFIDQDAEEWHDFNQQSAHDAAPIKNLLVTTKAFDVSEAVSSVRHRLGPNSCVVLLTNGMGYHEQVKSLTGLERIVAGSTTAGCHCPDRDTRVLAGAGVTTLGWLGGDAEPPAWAASIINGPWTFQWSRDIESVLMNKLAINAVINPPTALYDIPNGWLLKPDYQPVFERAISEVCALLRWRSAHDIATLLPERARQVALETAENTSSMRADFRAGRQTEVESILGYLLHYQAPALNATSRPATPLLDQWFSALHRPPVVLPH